MIREAPAVAHPPEPAGASTLSPAAEVFRVRAMVDGDLAFVTDSWLRSAWHAEQRKLAARGVSKRERLRASRGWFAVVRPQVEALIASDGVLIAIACDRDDESHVAGWVAIRADQELKLYVKHAYRPWGIEALLRGAVEAV